MLVLPLKFCGKKNFPRGSLSSFLAHQNYAPRTVHEDAWRITSWLNTNYQFKPGISVSLWVNQPLKSPRHIKPQRRASKYQAGQFLLFTVSIFPSGVKTTSKVLNDFLFKSRYEIAHHLRRSGSLIAWIFQSTSLLLCHSVKQTRTSTIHILAMYFLLKTYTYITYETSN